MTLSADALLFNVCHSRDIWKYLHVSLCCLVVKGSYAFRFCFIFFKKCSFLIMAMILNCSDLSLKLEVIHLCEAGTSSKRKEQNNMDWSLWHCWSFWRMTYMISCYIRWKLLFQSNHLEPACNIVYICTFVHRQIISCITFIKQVSYSLMSLFSYVCMCSKVCGRNVDGACRSTLGRGQDLRL